MKNRLALVAGLAVFGLAVAAGMVGAAQSTVLEVGEVSVDVNLPGQLQLPDVQGALPDCSNLKDDDGDGKIDLADPDCEGPLDDDEAGTAPPPDAGGGDDEPGGGDTGGDTDEPSGPSAITVGPNGSKTKKPTSGGGHQGVTPKGERKADRPPAERTSGGVPTNANPSLTIALPGPAPIGVPNFIIDRFSIPPFLLPIYQACGTQYSIPWQVLASINRIETAFGTNLNVSTAGAVGWMQFLPSTWKAYGVDANDDGRKDPYNPVDAICAAARYLRAAGGEDDLRTAIFAYNHADWYVDEVLLYANQYGRLPSDLIGSLTGLTEGARFPVAAPSRYADDISEREAARRAKQTGPKTARNVADVISDSPTRRGINIYSRVRAPVVAVNDGVIREIGKSKKLGRFIVLEDAYGNRFTYAGLGSVARSYPVPKERRLTASDFKLVTPNRDKAPETSVTGGGEAKAEAVRAASEPDNSEDARKRIFALPERPKNVGTADLTGQIDRLLAERFPGYEAFKSYFSGVLRFDSKTMEARKLKQGSKVIAGTVLGRIGKVDRKASPHVHFAIRPAGRGAKKIDPKPILDGWKLLEATAIYRASGENPFLGRASVGQILLMSKTQLVRRALNDPNLEVYSCGRQDIRSGLIDRRVLAGLEFLTQRGFRLTITSLRCGHSYLTKSGNVSHHSSGNAVDIAMINGIPVLGNQGKGSITEALVRELLQLQGTMRPAQVISLMEMGGPTFAMGDHADHVHVGWQPPLGAEKAGKHLIRILEPSQWGRLIDRLAEIEQPSVPVKPSKYSLPAKSKSAKRASDAHLGE